MLFKRGDAIKWKKWSLVNKINKDILLQCNIKRRDLYLPTRAYVTFENEFSSTKMRELEEAPLFGEPFQIKQAEEPTSINWENRNCENK